ncbi:Creatininase-like protein [Dioscorea alata]|uniref:Creatininase-like protein n=1 Tax=Dioscorea alata TaxID=55571 RepID=A0ACB7WIS4_DIOAL|nr:Creatininase-like protein [Dioscorea alata]
MEGAGEMIPQPETPKEPMEFLSRSWSLSALEISKALQANKKNRKQSDREMILPEKLMLAASSHNQHTVSSTVVNTIAARHSTVRKWFHSMEDKKSKEKVREEKARIHAAVTVASVAAAVAAAMVTCERSEDDECSKMCTAMASATQLLASHCIEIAEQAGAERERVDSAIRSAVDVRTPGDLMTLTAAAATALRGATALKMRMQRESRNNAAVIPYEKSQCGSPGIWCKAGDLFKRSRKGSLHLKRTSIYINKKSQVIVKLKTTHLGGAISKRKKMIVYGAYDEVSAWRSTPLQQQLGDAERHWFGLRTAEGLVEFECENEMSKQQWMNGVNNLLHQVNRRNGGFDGMDKSFQLLNLS